MTTRVERLVAALEARDLEGMLVSSPENRRYLSGFTGSAGVLLITAQAAKLATDFRYYEQVAEQAPDFELVAVPQQMPQVLARELRALGLERVAFESQDLTVETYNIWAQAFEGIELVPTSGIVEELRAVKEPVELEAIERAVRISDAAMVHLMDVLRPGMTERQVAWELEVHMRTHGAEALAFATIAAAGPRSAMSHAVPTERPIQEGEPMVIDMGARVDGYLSDMTRSFCVGWASDQYLEIWDTVLQAQLAAEKGIRAGMTGIEADALARSLIYGAGHEGKFGHGLGHSVGLAIHEDPRASFLSTAVLPEGLVLTVEPGIYLPGWGGIRTEDMIVVGGEVSRVLTQCPKVPVVPGK
ncbi:MAG: aminopeptidase P family protein [Chloroflexi bacterium]|nr:aminopeptidase P family protein [Chloroflexota bacterium]